MNKFKILSAYILILCMSMPVLLESITFKDSCLNKVPGTKVEYSKDQPKPNQRSLLMIFDTTGSMGTDLEQLKQGAREIVQELSTRADNPIYNYIFVEFNDPAVSTPMVTRDSSVLLNQMNRISINGGDDCPEMALGGLKKGLEVALPNSIVFLFSDASAKDYHLYEDVKNLIQKKQITVNFLLTGDCSESTSERYKVYHKISQVSNGQVYRMDKNKIKEVMMSIRGNMNPNYTVLKIIDVPSPVMKTVSFDVDTSFSELKVSVAGTSSSLTLRDPSGSSVTGSDVLSLSSLKIMTVKNPKLGTWTIEANAVSEYSVVASGLSSLQFNFGFSVDNVQNVSQTSYQPLSGNKNILTLFASDPTKVQQLSNVVLMTLPASSSEIATETRLDVKKVSDSVYATDHFEIPNQMFKIKIKGSDNDGYSIDRTISSALISSSGGPPEITINTISNEAYENGDLELRCTVKSLTPVDIAWTFNGKILNDIHSKQSNELKLTINNIKMDNVGIYKCIADNKASCETQEIGTKVLKLNIEFGSLPDKMVENSTYSLSCNIDDTKATDVEYSWIDNNGNLLQSGGNKYSFVPTFKDNGKVIKCQAKSKGATVEKSTSLNVQFGPKFPTEQVISMNSTFGSNARFNCSTVSNPTVNAINWYFNIKGSNDSILINHENKDTMDVEMNEKNEGTYECVVKNSFGEAKKQFTTSLVPKESPKISSPTKLFAVNITNSVELCCECTDCLPITNHTWTFEYANDYKIEEVKDEKENYFKTVLHLKGVDQNSNGNFSCKLENALGKDSTVLALEVQIPPEINQIILKKRNDSEIENSFEELEGQHVALDCIVEGYPKPTVSWLKDDKIVSNSSVLNFDKISVKDAGSYECFAENLLGDDSKTVEFIVNLPPRRENEDETSFVVIEGNEALLSCNLIGYPLPNISWYANSQEIKSNEKFVIDGRLLRFKADAEDSGIYSCISVNVFGSESIDFSVVVKSFPKFFSSNDESVSVENNTYTKLSCDATGYPKPAIRFIRNNTVISNETFYQIISANPSDSGVYHCIAENEVGTDEKIFYVTVVKRPSVTSHFNNITLYTNQTKELTCTAQGIPDPNIMWMFDDKETLSTNATVRLDSSLKNGKVSCVADNLVGSDKQFFYLETVNKPNLLSIANDLLRNISVREGGYLDLLCPYENYNFIEWHFNGSALNISEYNLIGRKLYVFNAKESYDGTWTCIVSNSEGKMDFSYDIKVLSTPVVLASWKFNNSITDFDKNDANIDQKVLSIGEDLLLNCTVGGSPIPKVEWRRGKDLIGRGEVLSINNLHFYHSDIYSCSAENNQGTVKKYFKVEVLAPPHINETLAVKTIFYLNLDESDEVLRCNSIIGNPEPLFNWFKNNEMLEGELKDHLVIEKVKRSDEGKYRCIGRNRFGSAEIKFEVNINEPAKVIQVLEADKSKKESDSVEISCIARGYPLPVVSWTFNGHIYSTTSKVNVEEIFKDSNASVVYLDVSGNQMKYLDPSRLNEVEEDRYSKLTKLDKKTLQLDLITKNTREIMHKRKFGCYTYNVLGQHDDSIEITVRQKPFIEKQNMPRNFNFKIFESLPLQLSCLIEGYPKPKVTWFKDGEQLFRNDSMQFIKDHRILNIPETTIWNGGNYTCVSKNDWGDLELRFDVQILSPPKFIDHSRLARLSSTSMTSDDFETVNVIEGGNTSLECQVEASPQPEIHWVKIDDFENDDEERFDLPEKSSKLLLKSVRQSSVYMCYANNTVGNTEKLFHLNVQHPPEFIENKSFNEDMIVMLHHSLKLDCSVKASPEATTYWSFDSTNLTKSDSKLILKKNNQTLQISDINKSHEGKFSCTSFNSIGQVQKSFLVKVEIPYTDWSKWSQCSEMCGTNGTQYRTRSCIIPEKSQSYECPGRTLETRKCNEFPCPINGGFSSWSDWSKCPSCYDTLRSEKPRQKRTRNCDSPSPAFGGLVCDEPYEETRECQIDVCSIDGGWSSWSDWSECTACYDAHDREKPKQTRSRICNSPIPAYGGLQCQGDAVEVKECKDTKICPVDGGWSAWSQWTKCPSCNDTINSTNNKRRRHRNCNSPTPAHGGRRCLGKSVDEQICRVDTPCPIDGGWSEWTDWSQCSAKCDQGVNTRIRFCKNPVPKYNGKNCEGFPIEKRPCKIRSCSITEKFNSLNAAEETMNLPFNDIAEDFSTNSKFEQLKIRSDEIICPIGFTFNPITKRCEDINNCNTGFVYNWHSRRCEDIRRCKIGYLYNSLKRICENIV